MSRNAYFDLNVHVDVKLHALAGTVLFDLETFVQTPVDVVLSEG